jgi:NADPH2:quinone reductase
MIAALYQSRGDADVLRVLEIATPSPGPGQVRVRLAVSGVNPTDWKTRRGAGPPRGQPSVPNHDGAGTIDAVGAGVSQSRIGERVWLLLAAYNNRWGTAAEYSIVPADRAVPLPDSAPFELGASLGIPALTAWLCLRAGGHPAGREVLVAGGAGAVGRAAIELARYLDADTVIATVSGAEKARIAQEAGAHTTVNYRDADAAEQIIGVAPAGVDRFVEVALDQNLKLDLKVAAPHAVISAYAAQDSTRAILPVRELMTANISLRFLLLYKVKASELAAAIHGVCEALKAGALTIPPLHRYPLVRIADAHDAVEQGAVGKVVIDFQPVAQTAPVPRNDPTAPAL